MAVFRIQTLHLEMFRVRYIKSENGRNRTIELDAIDSLRLSCRLAISLDLPRCHPLVSFTKEQSQKPAAL